MPTLKRDGAQPAERPPDTALQWQQARRILAIRLDNLGDVLMTTPALLCWQAGIPLRLAYSRENPYRLLTDWAVEVEPHEMLRHEVRRQIDLVARVAPRPRDDRLSFAVPQGAHREALEKLVCRGIDPARPYVVIHPGASAASRRYPPDLLAAALRKLTAWSGGDMPQLVFTGDAGEVALVEAIRLEIGPSVSLAGRLGLGELAVVLYHDVPCRYCYRSACSQTHHACLRLLDEGAEIALLAPAALPPPAGGD